MDEQSEREFKDQIYDQFSRIGKALGNARRLELLDLLVQGEHSVEALARETDMSVANTSQHLKHLRSTRLVESRRDGVKIYYRLADENVFAIIRALRQLSENRLAEMDRVLDHFLADRREMPSISFSKLIAEIEDDRTVILDVRPQVEYRTAHIPGAVSIPIEELEERVHEFPDENRIVVYCRGRYSVLSDKAVKLLLAKGYNAYRLEEGLPEWRVHQFPVEAGQPVEGVEELLT
jgi:rhodanese-related sulfurtransferase/DNA-binding transcriptional ArsR family regulator